jgi:zinc/manganese transport system permease protein
MVLTTLASNTNPPWSWNLLNDIRDMFAYTFMVNAFRAGTIVAVTASVVGWFMVLRKQTFAGHTLSVAAFPGAAGATLLGISATIGYFTSCIVAALVIALGSRPSRSRGFSDESAVVGTVQAFVLACGYLFAVLYKGLLSGVNSQLFGFAFGVTTEQVMALAVVGVLVLGITAVIGRPLLFSSVDVDVAQARGVGVRALGIVFMVVLGAAAAEASQITGALLVFALLVMPAATAQRLTPRPIAGIALSVVISVAVTWAGLATAYYTSYPNGFCITSFAFGGFLVANLVTMQLRRKSWTPLADVAAAHA